MSFQAASYEEIAQAPVLMGAGRARDIPLSSGSIRLVTFGAPGESAVDSIAGRFSQIASCQEQIFETVAAPEILVGLRWRGDLDYGGGASRRNAVVVNIGREWMENPGRFASGTSAHEFFHTWNFGLFFPSGSRPRRPFRDTSTRWLWFVEGVSDYYTLQTFVRLGWMDAASARGWVGSEVATFEASPARLWASLEDGGPMSAAEGIDIHAGGFVTAFVIDALVRDVTNSRSSLDDVVRALARRSRERPGTGFD